MGTIRLDAGVSLGVDANDENTSLPEVKSLRIPVVVALAISICVKTEFLIEVEVEAELLNVLKKCLETC